MTTRAMKKFGFTRLMAKKRQAGLNDAYIRLIATHRQQNLPMVYRDVQCHFRDQFIYEYPDGRKLLFRQSEKTSSREVICEL